MNDPNSYDTPLNPEEEAQFRKWAGPRISDLFDYDLRGFWKSGQAFAENGHGSDKWKKPNHPTFSDESVYSSPNMQGGHWGDAGGSWVFWASPQNLNARTIGDLSRYFQRNEPGNTVVFPLNYRLPRGNP